MRLLLLIRSLAPAQGHEAHPLLQATFRGRSTVVILVALLGLLLSVADTQPPFTIARLQYSGGGDWYSDPSGFLHADDNYGMDESFRREMRKVFPSAKWVELPADHPLFSCHFKLPDGLPKVHEHDGKRPQALALFVDKRIAVLYTYEADLGDGWEDPHVHDNPETRRRAALEMGANIAVWALSH